MSSQLTLQPDAHLTFIVIENNITLISVRLQFAENQSMKGFGQRLRERAEALGVPGATVASRVGLSQQRYHNYVADQTEPDLETLLRISDALAITPNELLGYEAEKAPGGEVAILQSRIVAATFGMSVPMLRTAAAVIDAMRKEDGPAKHPKVPGQKRVGAVSALEGTKGKRRTYRRLGASTNG